MTFDKIVPLTAAICTAVPAADLAADATMYGKAHLSVDYADVDMNAAWNRPAGGAPSFDVLTFIDGANEALNDAGYTEALPRPTPMNTVVGDLLFGTIPFDSLDPLTQVRILDALDRAATAGNAFRGWTVNASDRGSRLGIKGSEDLGRGLKAIYQIELAIPLGDVNGSIAGEEPGTIDLRNSFVGLMSSWGTLLVGKHDTPLKMSTGRLDLFADTLADYNYTVGFEDLRADNTVLYISPSLWGVRLTGAVVPGGGSAVGGISNPDANSIADSWSLAAIYARGPLHASIAYESLGSGLWRPQDGAYDNIHGVFAGDDTKWRVGLGLMDWHGFTMTGIYESRTDIMGLPVSAGSNSWQLQAGYAFGNNLLKAMYGSADLDACADPGNIGFRYTCSAGKLGESLGNNLRGIIDQQDKSTWALGMDHNFSKRTKVYALYTAVKDDGLDADWSGFSLGMAHKF